MSKRIRGSYDYALYKSTTYTLRILLLYYHYCISDNNNCTTTTGQLLSSVLAWQ